MEAPPDSGNAVLWPKREEGQAGFQRGSQRSTFKKDIGMGIRLGTMPTGGCILLMGSLMECERIGFLPPTLSYFTEEEKPIAKIPPEQCVKVG